MIHSRTRAAVLAAAAACLLAPGAATAAPGEQPAGPTDSSGAAPAASQPAAPAAPAPAAAPQPRPAERKASARDRARAREQARARAWAKRAKYWKAAAERRRTSAEKWKREAGGYEKDPSVPAPDKPGQGENTPLNLDLEEPRRLEAATGGGGGGGLVRTFVGLAVVIAVIYGLYWVLRQLKASREERSVGSGLQTTATIALGPNRSLHLVRAGREHVLVGVAEHGVVPIRTYSEDEAREMGLSADGDDGGDAGGDRPEPAGPALGGRPRRGVPTIGAALDELRRRTVRS